MSLLVDIKKVQAVRLPGDDSFRPIAEGSFSLDECQFTVMTGSKVTMWANWSVQNTGEWYACPFSTLVAIQYKK
jgi:hypothetical protein